MSEWIAAALMLGGASFMFLAALGVARFPHIFMRMQAAAKAGTLGVGLLLAAVAVYFGELRVTTASLLVIGFFYMTAPVAAHMIARAAYFTGVPRWPGTLADELEPSFRARHGPPAEEGEESG